MVSVQRYFSVWACVSSPESPRSMVCLASGPGVTPFSGDVVGLGLDWTDQMSLSVSGAGGPGAHVCPSRWPVSEVCLEPWPWCSAGTPVLFTARLFPSQCLGFVVCFLIF